MLGCVDEVASASHDVVGVSEIFENGIIRISPRLLIRDVAHLFVVDVLCYDVVALRDAQRLCIRRISDVGSVALPLLVQRSP